MEHISVQPIWAPISLSANSIPLTQMIYPRISLSLMNPLHKFASLPSPLFHKKPFRRLVQLVVCYHPRSCIVNSADSHQICNETVPCCPSVEYSHYVHRYAPMVFFCWYSLYQSYAICNNLPCNIPWDIFYE